MSITTPKVYRAGVASPMPRLTTAEAASVARRHPVTIRRALEGQELHGRQSMVGGRWLIRLDCLESWIDGDLCAHQQNVTPISRSRRARS